MKAKEDPPKKGAPAYMNTYGDMMTLLLTFFVLLFSMSSVDSQKFQSLTSAFSGGSGVLDGQDSVNSRTSMMGNGVSQFPLPKNKLDAKQDARMDKELTEIKDELQKYSASKKIEDKLVIEKNGDSVTIRFSDTLLFASGKADIQTGATLMLSTVGDKLKKYIEEGYSIRCEGHTDNIPIHNAQFPSNWELSGARAIAVARFFVEQMDFPRAQVSGEAEGEAHPIASNNTEEGRSKNRRVEIILTMQVN